MKLVQAIEMIQGGVFANGPMLVHVAEGEQLLVMCLAGTARANEVTAEAAATLINAGQARILDEVPEGIEHYSLLNGRYEPIAAPTNVTATAGDRHVVVSWDPVDRADSYVLYRCPATGVMPSAFTPIALDLHESTYRDHAVVNGQEYAYVVAGYDRAGVGPISDINSAPVGRSAPLPTQAPTATPLPDAAAPLPAQ